LIRVTAPLVLTAIASSLLFVSVDFTDSFTVLRASMGVALLFAVFARQSGMILDLDRHASNRERQLSVMGDVVSALSTTDDIQSTLKHTLERLASGLNADAGAVWLPAADGSGDLTLAEHTGMPTPDFCGMLLQEVLAAMKTAESEACQHRLRPPKGTQQRTFGYCLTVKLGRRAEDIGYLTVVRWQGQFDEPDGAVLSTIASDLAGTIRSVRLIAEAQRLADCDPITNLYNHRYLFQRLYSEVETHAAAGRPLSVLMLDLDNFKLYNDTYGHLAGDEVLKKAANILRRFFRESDIVARYGGDEFMVVLPNASLDNAIRCARRLQHRFSDEDFGAPGSQSVPIYVSCGVANYPHDGDEVLELVAIADANLYAAKAQGKGKITARTVDVMDRSLLSVEGLDLLRSLVIAVDNKDRYTRRHSEEVTAYAMQIAQSLKVSEELLKAIHVCGLLHDLGKIGVPDRILRKPGGLTPEEVAVMNQHPVIGALIVGSIPGMEQVVPGVRHHHERYDGLGYPDGLASEDIPLIARILAVADVYSAMTTHRPYRKALSRSDALWQIEKNLGTQFDPAIGALFVEQQKKEIAQQSVGEDSQMQTEASRDAPTSRLASGL
jgi:diguanylate cyclase (GGDEF)-like protein/putative nucleotidyltransferase with HDIG domain